MTTPLDPETFHRRKTLSKRAPLAMRTFDRAMRDGELPYYKVGNSVLIKEADLVAFLERHRRSFPPAASTKGRRTRKPADLRPAA